LAGRQQEKAKKQPRLPRPERQFLSGRDTRDPAGTEEINLEAKHAIPFGITEVNDAQRHAAFQQTTIGKSTLIRRSGARVARPATDLALVSRENHADALDQTLSFAAIRGRGSAFSDRSI
jgi:hypothetical protein